MAYFEWKKDYSVGVESIDEQHKAIVKELNRLYEAMQAGRGQDVLNDVMSELGRYTSYHFTLEEKMMADYGDPGLVKHKLEHKALLDEVAQKAELVKKGGATAVFEVSEFVRKWLVNHIAGSDMLYSELMISKGAK